GCGSNDSPPMPPEALTRRMSAQAVAFPSAALARYVFRGRLFPDESGKAAFDLVVGGRLAQLDHQCRNGNTHSGVALTISALSLLARRATKESGSPGTSPVARDNGSSAGRVPEATVGTAVWSPVATGNHNRRTGGSEETHLMALQRTAGNRAATRWSTRRTKAEIEAIKQGLYEISRLTSP
ncbi:MAG TPA: hypothetical protein VEJ84_19435, partial [Acidimicrobiales bacterium]|nr:hypothetical protein [Acidimicrobiales bacterium]